MQQRATGFSVFCAVLLAVAGYAMAQPPAGTPPVKKATSAAAGEAKDKTQHAATPNEAKANDVPADPGVLAQSAVAANARAQAALKTASEKRAVAEAGAADLKTQQTNAGVLRAEVGKAVLGSKSAHKGYDAANKSLKDDAAPKNSEQLETAETQYGTVISKAPELVKTLESSLATDGTVVAAADAAGEAAKTAKSAAKEAKDAAKQIAKLERDASQGKSKSEREVKAAEAGLVRARAGLEKAEAGLKSANERAAAEAAKKAEQEAKLPDAAKPSEKGVPRAVVQAQASLDKAKAGLAAAEETQTKARAASDDTTKTYAPMSQALTTANAAATEAQKAAAGAQKEAALARAAAGPSAGFASRRARTEKDLERFKAEADSAGKEREQVRTKLKDARARGAKAEHGKGVASPGEGSRKPEKMEADKPGAANTPGKDKPGASGATPAANKPAKHAAADAEHKN